MYHPDSIEIENLLSHSNSHYIFENGKCIMVYGINLDGTGVESNGAGKSVLIEAIAIALTGSPFRDIKNAELVKNGEKVCTIIFHLTNSVTKHKLSIYRTIHSGTKSSSVYIEENGIENKELRTQHPRETDKYILQLLDISKEDLLNYFIISKERYVSFFLSGDTAKKQIINRFSNADMINPLDDIIKKEIDNIDVQIQKLETKKIEINTSIGIYAGQLNECSLSKEQEKKDNEILELRQRIDNINNAILDKQRGIQVLSEEWTNTKKECDLLSKDYIFNENITQSLREEIQSYTNEIDKLNADRLNIPNTYQAILGLNEQQEQEIRKQIKDIQAELSEFQPLKMEMEAYLAGAIECPNCLHKFVLADKTIDLEEVKKTLPEVIETIKQKDLLQEDCQNKLKEFYNHKQKISQDIKLRQDEISADIKIKFIAINQLNIKRGESVISLNKKTATLKDYVKKCDSLEININNLTSSLPILRKDINSIEQCIIDIQSRPLNTKATEIQDKLNSLNEELQGIEGEQSVWYAGKGETEQWQFHFKKFKSYLANTAINNIQACVNSYLKNMNTDLSIIIDGFRTLSNSKVKEEITVSVSRDGLSTESFNKFSGGEKVRVDIACILAMQRLINNNSKSGGLDLLFLDEIIESVDGAGVREIVKALSKLGQNIFIITHTNPNIDFSDKLVIEKTNGNSIIVQNSIVSLKENLVDLPV